MKVYVAEQPECCLDCKFCNKENYCCWLMQKDVRDYRDNCPLQSLIEHDKQVRKEVCEEIKDKIKQAKLIYEWKGEEITIEEMEEILQLYKERKEAYLKRLERYYKRYGNHIHTNGYWRDR